MPGLDTEETKTIRSVAQMTSSTYSVETINLETCNYCDTVHIDICL